MKTKSKIFALSLTCLSSCATIPNTQYDNTTIYTYNTVCINQNNLQQHYFETRSYIPLGYEQVVQAVYHEGKNNFLDMDIMNCSQVNE